MTGAFKEHAQNGLATARRACVVPYNFVPRLRGLCATLAYDGSNCSRAGGFALLCVVFCAGTSREIAANPNPFDDAG